MIVEVRSPTAAIQVSENGACPPSCRQGWKWSLTATDSMPCCSAATAISTSSRGSNCSALALYPRVRLIPPFCPGDGSCRVIVCSINWILLVPEFRFFVLLRMSGMRALTTMIEVPDLSSLDRATDLELRDAIERCAAARRQVD